MNPSHPSKEATPKDEARPALRRRSFLKAAAALGAAAAFPTIVPSSVFGANAPSKRITFGCIGVGRMGRGDMSEILGRDDCQVLAVCDLDTKRLEDGKKLVEKIYSARVTSGQYKGCDMHGDFRELIARKDIDAVTICTPDHWHMIPTITAAKAGKDIFLQKPLSLTISEGRIISDTVRRYGVVYITGSQQRSEKGFRYACELVRNGRIGKLHTVKIAVGTDPGTTNEPEMPVPSNLNYDMWLGPAPYKPYTEKRVHPQKDYGRPGWLRIADYGAGMLTGWGAHHVDIAHWGMGTEYTGPVEISGEAEFPTDGLWDVHGPFRIEYLYANGVKVIFADQGKLKAGVTFEGTEGWVWVTRGGIDANPKSLLTSVIGPNEIHLYNSTSHKGNLIDCIRTRAETVAPVEVGHRTCSVCLLSDIAIRLKRKLKWNPDIERFVGDPEADRMLSRPMRAPWHL